MRSLMTSQQRVAYPRADKIKMARVRVPWCASLAWFRCLRHDFLVAAHGVTRVRSNHSNGWWPTSVILMAAPAEVDTPATATMRIVSVWRAPV